MYVVSSTCSSMNQTRASVLDVLEPGVLPVAPLTRTFAVVSANGKWESTGGASRVAHHSRDISDFTSCAISSIHRPLSTPGCYLYRDIYINQ